MKGFYLPLVLPRPSALQHSANNALSRPGSTVGHLFDGSSVLELVICDELFYISVAVSEFSNVLSQWYEGDLQTVVPIGLMVMYHMIKVEQVSSKCWRKATCR